MAHKKLPFEEARNVRAIFTLGLKTTVKATETVLFYQSFFNVCVLTLKIIRIFINI